MKFRNWTLLFAALAVLFGGVPAAWSQAEKDRMGIPDEDSGFVLRFEEAEAKANEAKEDAAHEELRSLLKEVLTAYNKGDLDALIAALDDEVVVTWQNGKVNKGPKEVKTYYEEMTKGPKRAVQKSSIEPVPDDLSILYNDGKTAVAWGKSKDHYLLTDGTEFDQETRWSAALVKKDGKWKAVNIHISVNMFDNPVLDLAIKKTGIWIGGVAGGVGLVLGLIVGVLACRSRAKSAA